MSRVVELGDKLVIDTSKGGFKVAPDKCEFLDNLIIKDIECNVVYPIDVVKDAIGEGSNLRDWMTQPDANCGMQFKFSCNLYNKETVISVGGPDHADYDEPLTTDWIEALNIIIDTMRNHDEDTLSSYVESVESNAQGKTFKEYMKSVSDTESVHIFITRDMLIEEIYTI